MVIEQVTFPRIGAPVPSVPKVPAMLNIEEKNLVRWGLAIIGVAVVIFLIRYFQVRAKMKKKQKIQDESRGKSDSFLVS